MRKSMRRFGLFGTGVIISFSLALAAVGHSAVATVSAVACGPLGFFNQAGSAKCRLPAGTAMPVSDLQGVYFDFNAAANLNYTCSITKMSFTGTVSSDTRNVSYTSAQSADVWVDSVNTKANPSQWDYLAAELSVSSGNLAMFGVAEVNTD
jgi:hypothetical protein